MGMGQPLNISHGIFLDAESGIVSIFSFDMPVKLHVDELERILKEIRIRMEGRP